MPKPTFTGSQQAAIDQLDGNLQLIACAGSGKTEVVAQRVVNLLRPVDAGGGGCRPENIIAFTFTDKAAAELKERIHARCNEQLGQVFGLAEMYVGTIHGFCLDLLKTEVPKYMKYEVLDEVTQALFVDRNSSLSGLTRATNLKGVRLKRYTDTSVYVKALSILREDDVSRPVELEGNSVAVQLRDYETLLESKAYLDYSGILKEAVASLRANEALRERLIGRVRHVIVDEYQDVNPIQESIVRELHGLGARVCVVGDDDQTIYQWRGSDVRNILSFSGRYENVSSIRLEENFRSSKGIVDVATAIVENLSPRLEKEMKSTEAQAFEPGDIVALEFGSPEEEAEYIAETCSALSGVAIRTEDGDRGISWSDMAILLRSVRRDGQVIMAALESAGVPAVIAGMDNLFERREVEAARQLFYFLAQEVEEPAVLAAWEAADLGVDADALGRAIAEASRARASMESAEVGKFKVYNLQRQFMAFLENAGLREERVPGGRGEVVFYNLGMFSQAISDFESIHFHSVPIEKYKSFAGFLRFRAENSYPEGWQENSFVNPDAVRIMTVHQAKGLQWPVVFVPQLVRNRFPAKGGGGRTPWHLIPAAAFERAERYKGSVADERRLFYVATTRSQKYLHMTWAPHADNQQAKAPSDFFREVQTSNFVKRRKQDYSGRRRLVPTPKTSIASVTLSFSDIKYFFECPYQFKLRILYGFNAPLDEALGFGKSLHDALAEVHSRSIAGEVVGPGEARELVDRHLRVPYAYAALKEKLRGAAERNVEGYIRKNADDLRNLEFSEKGIEIALGDGISVAGRIDLVRKRDTGEVTIVDLKSSELAQTQEATDKQLHIYALGYEELTGRRPDKVETYELDRQRALPLPVDEEFIEEVKRDVLEVADGLRRNRMPTKPSPKTCGNCDYRGVCRDATTA